MKPAEQFKEVIRFLKLARHLWGRCPRCSELFRLSEVTVTYGSQVPKDWLDEFQKERDDVLRWRAEVEQKDGELTTREREVRTQEFIVDRRQGTLDKQAKKLAMEYVRSKESIRKLIREERKTAVMQSRATRLGKLFERLLPFMKRFTHDPGDIRPLMEPIDYICFDGLTARRHVERITFVEVKSGASEVTKTERSILEAVRRGKVESETWYIGKRGIPLHEQLGPHTR